ncbi:MFS transporter [Cytophagaceae bacterium DM2B3-1]|uniref:MFS transporter n=1 Tax=Xanthocytophaga flava TaxID=3048013 RepID=A0ABT7CR36_9BACT|nr:MFS transporter [Xanthocytophaga flavus]MDJ1496213.1 MFS transporter [Xanthocytophaga flavus]
MKNTASLVYASTTTYSILFAISVSHLLNDVIQSVISAMYPMLKENYALSFAQIGIITLAYQLTASILQPFVGSYTDKNPFPKALIFGMCFSMTGLLTLAFGRNFYTILGAVSLVGVGSSIFHPEASRVAHLASGGKKGLAQSIFQVGGNLGSAIGPLLAALIVVPLGQSYISVFAIMAVFAIIILSYVSKWYEVNMIPKKSPNMKQVGVSSTPKFTKNTIAYSIVILLGLMFSKFFYMASMSNYYTFFLIEKFHLTVQQSQIYLFAFLGAVAVGTIAGGPIGDRYGRKIVIWASILGAAPFAMLLPYVSLEMTVVLSVIIGLLIASAFSAILVYATELIPGKVGSVAGLFFGLSFGMGGIGSALLGWIADMKGIMYVFSITPYLLLIGLVTYFLPKIER